MTGLPNWHHRYDSPLFTGQDQCIHWVGSSWHRHLVERADDPVLLLPGDRGRWQVIAEDGIHWGYSQLGFFDRSRVSLVYEVHR
jgi:hypothetical protein